MTRETHAAAIRQFAQQADEQSSLQGLLAAFLAALHPYGYTTVAVGQLEGGGMPATMFMTNWPRLFLEHYATNALIHVDPVVAHAKRSSSTRTWDEIVDPHNPDHRALLATLARFGLQDGFAIPVHGPADRRGVSALVAPARVRLDPERRAAVTELGRLAYEKARLLFLSPQPHLTLPRREKQALALVARGLDDAAIGVALGVTRDSAHVYVERAKKRLGASTRAQAVAIAVNAGLL